MNFLDFFFIVSGSLLFFLALDIARKKRFNFVHVFVFIAAALGLLIFTFFPHVLDSLWRLFGIPRGADVLVYSSIIFLTYFSLLLLSKHYDTKESITQLIRSLAIEQSPKQNFSWNEVIVIPAYNEWKHLFTTLKSIMDAGYNNIIVINDGSTDSTRFLSKNFDAGVVFLHHLHNRWQGAALETGFEYVRRYGDVKYVVTFDADGQHSIDDLWCFYDIFSLKPNTQIIFGSRFLWATHNMPKSRRYILQLAKIFTRCMSRGVKLSDTHNWFRVIRSDILDSISLSIDGMAHASEFIDLVSQHKLRYSEAPITISYSDYSLEKGQRSRGAFSIALRFIWAKIFR